MTVEEANEVVKDHIKWLEGEGCCQTVATALRVLFFEMGKRSAHSPLTKESSMNLGKIAYEAYCKSSGNKSLISGAELPAWEQLKPEIQNAWNATGKAVGNVVLDKTLEVAGDSLTEAARRGFESVQHKD